MVEQIDIKNILPDEDQPRKYFAADKMFQLKKSIQRHGIINPLVIEDMGKGKYLLIDGERRFRAAVELKLGKVPATVMPPQKEAERLIQQFTIQEQHESWTPIEKAMSLLALSKSLGESLINVCKLLNVDSRSTARYIAFAELADKESYVKNEVPLDYATSFKQLKGTVKRITETVLEQEFTRSDEKKLEHQITKLVIKGLLTKRSDLSRLSDAFKKNPKLIDKFMSKDNVTPSGLFIEARAQGAYHLRNTVNQCRSLVAHGKLFLQIRDVKITHDELELLKQGRKVLNDLIGLVE